MAEKYRLISYFPFNAHTSHIHILDVAFPQATKTFPFFPVYFSWIVPTLFHTNWLVGRSDVKNLFSTLRCTHLVSWPMEITTITKKNSLNYVYQWMWYSFMTIYFMWLLRWSGRISVKTKKITCILLVLSLSLYLKKPFIMMLFSLLMLISINHCRLSKHEFKIHISPMSAHFHGMVILVFYFYSSVCMCGTLPFQILKMVMILAKLKYIFWFYIRLGICIVSLHKRFLVWIIFPGKLKIIIHKIV